MLNYFIISGQRGRPKINISREQLLAFHKANFTGVQMASHFQCSTKLVYSRLKEEGLNLKERFNEISDQAMDEAVEELKESFPKAGAQVLFV